MCQHFYSSLMQVVVKGKKYQITVYILASVYNNKVLKPEIGTQTSKRLLHSSFELNLPKQKLTQFELCLTWSSTNQLLSMVKAEPAQSGPKGRAGGFATIGQAENAQQFSDTKTVLLSVGIPFLQQKASFIKINPLIQSYKNSDSHITYI